LLSTNDEQKPIMQMAFARIEQLSMKSSLHRFVFLSALVWLAAVPATSCFAANTNTPTGDTVIVVKWATHPALDELQSSFLSKLEQYQKTNLDNVHFTIQRRDADADNQRAVQIAERSFGPEVRLIVTLGTPCSQAVCRMQGNIPVLYAAVSDPNGAGLFKYPNVSGIANVSTQIIAKAIQTIKKLVPSCKTLGTIYNPAEENSVFVQTLIEKECILNNLVLVRRRVSETDRLPEAAQSLLQVANVDAIFCANDNKVNLGIASIVSASVQAKKPFIIGEVSAIKKGAAAAVGVDYTAVGISLADMAIQILNGKDAKQITPTVATESKIILHTEVLQEIGLTVPPELQKEAIFYSDTKP
jgi:putative ABC transport system substrate-binding protein